MLQCSQLDFVDISEMEPQEGGGTPSICAKTSAFSSCAALDLHVPVSDTQLHQQMQLSMTRHLAHR